MPIDIVLDAEGRIRKLIEPGVNRVLAIKHGSSRTKTKNTSKAKEASRTRLTYCYRNALLCRVVNQRICLGCYIEVVFFCCELRYSASDLRCMPPLLAHEVIFED